MMGKKAAVWQRDDTFAEPEVIGLTNELRTMYEEKTVTDLGAVLADSISTTGLLQL